MLKPTAPSFRPALEASGKDRGLYQIPYKSSTDSRGQIPCRFFQQGRCNNGAICPYLHQVEEPTASDEPRPIYHPESPTDSRSPNGTATRALSSVLVRFDSGAKVSRVTMSSDYSAVHIDHLPAGSSRESIIELLSSQRVSLSKSPHIRVVHLDSKSTADIKVEDPEFAKQVCAKLGPQMASRKGNLSQPVATPVQPLLYGDANALRVDHRKVYFSWHKPSKTVWLNFGSREIASRVDKKFKDGNYLIKNRRVTSETLPRAAGRHNALAWTVTLTDVPGSATEQDVKKAIRVHADQPRGIQLGKPTYSEDAETCYATILSLFNRIGELEFHELTPDPVGKRFKAKARFIDAAHAQEAETQLNNHPLPFNPNGKLSVQEVHSAKFKVSRPIYQVVRAQLQANIAGWKAKHLSYTAYEQSNPPTPYVVLKVEGTNNEDVAAAKKDIEGITAGRVAKDGTSTSWHPMLRGSGPLLAEIEKIAQHKRVLLVRNKYKSEIRLYGLPNTCEEVNASIARVLDSSTSESRDIILDESMLNKICRGGFHQISEALVGGSVRLDVVSRPKRVIINGSVNDYETAMKILGGEANGTPSTKGTDLRDCSICYTAEPDAIRTKCGHTYCLDCFEDLCMAATKKDRPAEVKCEGNLGKCGIGLDLPELQEHLSPSAFEELLKLSFASYVRCHPSRWKYCPTADCDSVYRACADFSTLPLSHHCPVCLVDVCTKCHAQHEQMTCGDFQDLSTGGYEAYQRVKKELGIKDCPKCGTAMEKTDGCDHMTCRCGAHICWVCMKTFTTSGDCYAHMNKEHQGIYRVEHLLY
ncbi:hypothetical protein GGR57DRAFT_513094 [Xylariaceae sp. FL1272]|nr:hypothetical protein GGR57DRAFT_513094 [Xylariaceae sp. FL1272]